MNTHYRSLPVPAVTSKNKNFCQLEVTSGKPGIQQVFSQLPSLSPLWAYPVFLHTARSRPAKDSAVQSC